MEWEEEDWIENTLKEAERRQCVRKVLSVDKLAAVAKGDNYTSELSRLKLRVQLMDGQVVDKWAIYKNLPDTEFRRRYMKESGLFTIEVRMYKEVLPLLENIRREKEVGDPLWGECYGIKGYETLLLEDLSIKGFKMGERKKGLDFEHCALVMRGLAKYHALTVILRERGDVIISDYERHYFQRNLEMVDKFCSLSFDDLANTIETRWEEEWKDYAKALRKIRSTLADDMLKSFDRDDSQFNVLNHGDCWVNNMLFKYGADGRPISMRFVDFQISFYNSPGFDLQYFLHTSPHIEARSRTAELVQIYYDSLISDLDLFGFSGTIPTMDDIQKGLKKAALYGLACGVAMLPLMMIKSEDVPDMEDMLKKHIENQDMDLNLLPKDGEDFRNAIKAILVSSKDKGLLQL